MDFQPTPQQIDQQLFLIALQNNNPHLDARDMEILSRRAAAFASHETPKTGDFLEFADGIKRRISHVWFDEKIQTSDDGSWYLGDGYMSFSGALYQSIPIEALSLKGEKRLGSCWFFHHNHQAAHNGVNAVIPCQVWTTELTAASH